MSKGESAILLTTTGEEHLVYPAWKGGQIIGYFTKRNVLIPGDWIKDIRCTKREGEFTYEIYVKSGATIENRHVSGFCPIMTKIKGDVIIVKRYEQREYKGGRRRTFGRYLLAGFALWQFHRLFFRRRRGFSFGPRQLVKGTFRIRSDYFSGNTLNAKFFKKFKSEYYYPPRKIKVGYIFRHKTKPLTYVLFNKIKC